jgi:hypothetical protein
MSGMATIPHLIDVRDDDGLAVVTVLFDLTPPQVDAGLHALRVVRDARYRLVEVATDDVLAMREMTALVDELAEVVGEDGIARFHVSVARLGVLRDGLSEFTAGEHLEREGDSAAHPVAWQLLDGLQDLHAEAVHAALHGISPVR